MSSHNRCVVVEDMGNNCPDLTLYGGIATNADFILTTDYFMGEDKLIEELNALRRFELLAQKERVLINPGIQKGDRVLITEGPLKGLTTEVIRRNDECDSIVVNISILNRNIEYPVSAETLQKITD